MRAFPFNLFLYYLLIVFLAGCETSQNLTIQVLTPPEMHLSSGRGKYVLLNRIPSLTQFLETDSIKAGDISMSISYYNYLSWEAVNGCLDILELSPVMDSIILDTLLYKHLSADSLKEVRLIDPGFIHDLCVKYGTNGVISLDEISLFDTLEIRPLFERSEEIENARGIIANEKIWPGTRWRVYSDSGSVLVDYTFNDTLSWQGIDFNEEYAVNQLPLLIDMLPMALQHSGETLGVH